MHIGLDGYEDQIKDLQTMKWRYKILIHVTQEIMTLFHFLRGKSLRIFVSGDYEVLCRLYGITGATSRNKSIINPRAAECLHPL